jgi:hypothetical protein
MANGVGTAAGYTRNPHSEVAVKELQTGEVTVVVTAWAG